MISNTVLMLGLWTASASAASIHIKVTDTSGTVPIAGAVLQWDAGGSIGTTDSTGAMEMPVGLAHPGAKPRPGAGSDLGLSKPGTAVVRGRILITRFPMPGQVDISGFDAKGSQVLAQHIPVAAGLQTYSLPRSAFAMVFYRIRMYGENILTQQIIGGRTAKKSGVATLKDILSVTKAGYLPRRIPLYELDTGTLLIRMRLSAGTVTDGDGNVYQTVQIGNQIWMAENLRATKYFDGTALAQNSHLPSGQSWGGLTQGAYASYNKETDSDSIKKYGLLYNWFAVDPTNPHQLAPTQTSSWHVPTEADWDTLSNFLISQGYNWEGSNTGDKTAKSLASQADWDASNVNGNPGNDSRSNNRSGFSALPGGSIDVDGAFWGDRGNSGDWWASSPYDSQQAPYRQIYYNGAAVVKNHIYKNTGYSVRFVRNLILD